MTISQKETTANRLNCGTAAQTIINNIGDKRCHKDDNVKSKSKIVLDVRSRDMYEITIERVSKTEWTVSELKFVGYGG